MSDGMRRRHNQVMAENAELREALWAIANAYDRFHRRPLKTLEDAKNIAVSTLDRVKL